MMDFNNVRRVTNQNRSNRCATDNDQLGRLHENQKVPFFHKIATGDTAEDDKNANDRKQRRSLPFRAI